MLAQEPTLEAVSSVAEEDTPILVAPVGLVVAAEGLVVPSHERRANEIGAHQPVGEPRVGVEWVQIECLEAAREQPTQRVPRDRLHELAPPDSPAAREQGVDWLSVDWLWHDGFAMRLEARAYHVSWA